MFTRFLGTENWKGLSATYVHDDQIDFINNNIHIDGNLTTSFTNVLSNVSDFKKNNFSHLFLTQPVDLSVVTDFSRPEDTSTIYTGTIYNTYANKNYYLRFTDQLDASYAYFVIYDQTADTPLSAINDFNFFELDVTHSDIATIAHYYNTQRYFLCFNPATLDLNMMGESSFTSITDYTRHFYYTFNVESRTATFQARVNGISYTIIRNPSTMRLVLTATNNISFTESKKIFNMVTFLDPASPEITNNWVSYDTGINQNNININTTNSYFGVRGNFLIHSEYTSATDSKYASNILTLKNQLNLQNHQGRGGVGLSNEITYREYNNLFAGGRQEKGHDKLSLGYSSYTTPYTFKQGKTTWFHAPQNMYPYQRLNIKSSSLVKAGAIAGDHPLRSDKVWKKIGNYRNTSNVGTASEEQNGQWLCSWLSGAPDINAEPVWVDRFYNPKLTTPFRALTADAGTVTYIPSFDCYNLNFDITDVPSSLTFEPGCWYAYSHIGEADALQNIKVWSPIMQQENFTSYLLYNFQQLDPELYDGVNTYVFNGSRFAYFDVKSFSIPQNVFTIAFWAYRDNWSIPTGYQIAGNYMDYGLGIFNYYLVTPFLLYFNGGKITSLNQDLDVLNTYDSGISAFGKLKYVLRRDALNSFHVITEDQQLLEFDLKETITDATSALSGRFGIKDVCNDENYGYVLYNNNSVAKFDLVSNLVVPAVSGFIVGNNRNILEIRPTEDGTIGLIGGTQSICRDSRIYTLSTGRVVAYDVTTRKLSSFIGSSLDTYDCFNIDKYSNTWLGSANNISVYGGYQTKLFETSLSALSSFSTIPVSIKNITFIENFNAGELNTDVIVAASGSQTNKTILFKLNYDGYILDTAIIDTVGGMILSHDPSNHKFNYSYLQPLHPNNTYDFKLRLYSQFNNEDIAIPAITLSASDLNKGWHHFAITLNPPEGTLKLYVDGEFYDSDTFTPNKYNFIPLITDTIYAGATPFYGGLTLSDALFKNNPARRAYIVKDLIVQDLYFISKELNYFDVGMLYKKKMIPGDLVWDMPSGRRNFLDTASRYFKQRVPGHKSGLVNIYINDNVLDGECRDYISTAVANKIKDYLPGYSLLNNITWVTNNLSQSAQYARPLLNGGSAIGN